MLTTDATSSQENFESSPLAFPQTAALELYRARSAIILSIFDLEFITPDQAETWLLRAERGEFPVSEIIAALLAVRPQGYDRRAKQHAQFLSRIRRLGGKS